MAHSFDRMVSVLVGPSCPTCEPDDLHRGAPLGVLRDGRCRDCGTEYRWYEMRVVDVVARPEPKCPGCGIAHDEQKEGTVFCEDCGPSDCVFCGITTLRWLLSEQLACRSCEGEETA
jgi:hypothetical protein